MSARALVLLTLRFLLFGQLLQADLEGCPTEEILLVRDPDKVYGEMWFFTFTQEAFDSQVSLAKAGEEEEKARLAAENEVWALLFPHKTDCENSCLLLPFFVENALAGQQQMYPGVGWPAQNLHMCGSGSNSGD